MNPKKLCAIAITLIIAVPICLGFALSMEESERDVWNVSQSVNVSDLLLNSTTDYYGTFTGSTNNTSIGGTYPQYVDISSTASAYPYYTIVEHDISANVTTAVSYSMWRATFDGYYSSLTLTINGIPRGTQILYSTVTLAFNDGVLSWNGSEYATGVESISIHYTNTYTIYEMQDNGQYADVSAGWRIPANTPLVWNNNQSNIDYTVVVNLPVGDTVRFSRVSISNTSGTISATYVPPVPSPDPEPVHVLGNYSNILVKVGIDYVEVSGLSAWPAMAIAPQTYNTVKVAIPGGSLDSTIRDVNGTATFRVESSTMVAGTFPSTLNKSFDMSGLYPSGNYRINFNSIGVYGDDLAINGVSYPVDNGKITIDGKKVNLKGISIASVYDVDHYTVTINGIKVADSATPLIVYFGGEWSLTATAEILEKSTTKSMEWVPGGFGLSKEGFIAAGLITAIATFIILGMSGKMSGSKIALLAFICGSAGVCLLIMI